jgi:hypothetical protein
MAWLTVILQVQNFVATYREQAGVFMACLLAASTWQPRLFGSGVSFIRRVRTDCISHLEGLTAYFERNWSDAMSYESRPLGKTQYINQPPIHGKAIMSVVATLRSN